MAGFAPGTRVALLFALGLVLASGPIALAQAGAAATAPSAAAGNPLASKFEFELATIKADHPRLDGPPTGVQLSPDRVVINLLPLTRLICVAFNVSTWQIQGGEGWMESDLFDIQAKPSLTPQSSPYSLNHSNMTIGDQRLREMMQTLLIERFQLKFHRETKTGTISILEKSGQPVSLRPAKQLTTTPLPYGEGFSGTIGATATGWRLVNTSMPQLAEFLSGVVRHPVVDKTGLGSSYDFRSATALTAEDFQGGPMNTFLPVVGEMGLKLTRAKGAVETFVIDHAEHPSAN